mmetsp:Transcript_3558/g.7227  ORF Transcript_3558/g.7227 Transcript_3558/m.7227 type:complete len:1219 (-) Transcript_3558:204-3860(-)
MRTCDPRLGFLTPPLMMAQITGIKLYSQNINGLSHRKFLQSTALLAQYDIILLQETHLTQRMTQTYTSTLQSRGWRTYWGPAKRKNTRPKGGVAIWIKESLFSNRVILSCRKLSHSRSSHILSLALRCQDQRFVLSTVYMPIQNNREAVDECISILHHLAVQNTVIWCGDFNFIEDTRDTTSRTAPRKSLKAYTHEAATTRQQEQPTRSRLDRIYCSSAYRHMITTVHVHSQPRVHSDHLPISTNIKLVCPRLRQQQRGTKQQRRNCIPQQFLNNPAYKERYCQEMQEWLHQLVESTPRMDFSTWLTIKKQIATLAIKLNREYRADIQQQIRQNQQAAQITEDSLDLKYLHKADAHIMLPSPSKDLTIPGLVQPTGRITESAVECANILVDQYAAVSAQPDCSPWAQQYLLNSIPMDDTRIFPDSFREQATEITAEEILQAIKRMRTSAPGDDGIKLTLYRLIKQELAPILQQVYTQLVFDMPAEFLYGVIIPIHKKDSPYQPSNYRPITLLNTDYRIMQQVLLGKLERPLQKLVSPTQSAFLPGRCITDTIWTIQLLPQYLTLHKQSAYFAVCDFSKAYDKIDRHLLFRLCSTLKIPRFLCLWIRQILSQTHARVYLNGSFSHKRRFDAGVRQGDPVSPYLYLLISHLLTRHLQHTAIYQSLPLTITMHHHHQGIEKATSPLKISTLQYADDNTVPLSLTQIERFIDAMDIFAAGTGQHLNKNKTWLLPIGAPTGQPTAIKGLRVVPSATILGIELQANSGLATFDWAPRLHSLEQYCKLLAAQLSSSFTKFSRLSTYKLPQELYRAEIVPPSDQQIEQIYHTMRSLLPSKTGWSSRMFPANTKMGGLGCLPLKEHLHARDLKWVTQLFTMGTSKLWVQLVWNIFLRKYTNVDQDALEAVAHLPTPLRALITHVHGDETIIQSAAADSLTWIRTLWHKIFTDYQLKQSGVAPQTLTAALPCLQPPEVQPQWQRRGETIPLEDYTVKFGTLLLTEGQQADRNYRWQQWLEIIQDKRMSDSQECLFQHPIRWRPLYRVLPPLSRLPIPSAYKIAFWETIMRTGITSERIKVDQPCICHFSPVQPGRAHFFYHCPIALSLCSTLFQVDLQAAQDIIRSIWMVHPWGHYPLDAWALICIATTYSIDTVRKAIHKAQREQRVQSIDYYIQVTRKVCVSILTCYTHVLEAGSPSLASSAPLQWSQEAQCWQVSPLVSPFSPQQ